MKQCEGCKIKPATKSYPSGDKHRYFCGKCYVNRLRGKITVAPLDKDTESEVRAVQ